MSDVGGAITAQSNFDRLAFEADWRRARHTTMFEDEISQSAFCIGGGLTAFFFVGDVYKKFDDAAILTVRDGIGEGMYDDVAIAEEGFVVDGGVEVAGEAGIVPEEDAVGTIIYVAG